MNPPSITTDAQSAARPEPLAGEPLERRLEELLEQDLFAPPEQFADFLKSDRAASARLVRESGMEPQ